MSRDGDGDGDVHWEELLSGYAHFICHSYTVQSDGLFARTTSVHTSHGAVCTTLPHNPTYLVLAHPPSQGSK
jgi:hypothetical protein